MIVAMKKAFVVARARDRDRLLDALGRLGVVHLAPVDRSRAVPDEETLAAIDRFGRAIQVLESTPAAAQPLDLAPAAAVDEVLRIQRQAAERSGRLSVLFQQVEQLAMWGNVRLDTFEALRRAGMSVKFYAVPRDRVGAVRAACVQPLGPWSGRRVVVAVVERGDPAEVPEGSETIPLPSRDRPSILAEAASIDADLKRDAQRLSQLVHLLPAIRAEHQRLQNLAAWTVATRSALADEHLYALQGWVPDEKAESLAPALAAEGIEAAVEVTDPAPGEEPPTLVKYPRWARPMEGLFRILGTVPGYAEFDVSAMFMIFLPVFSAILISDTGYGLMYLALPLVFYRKMAAAGAAALAQLVIVIGACSVIWGLLTGSFFGFSMCQWPVVGDLMPKPIVPVDMQKESMDYLMFLSVTLGAIQLSLAHLWKARAAFPRLVFLSEVGWAVWLWGMYGLVKMFLLKDPFGTDVFPYYPYMLAGGGVLAVVFANPDRNPLKMIGLGMANFPLSAIGTFGDTVSYVRLMAIGLAGSALAVAFNDMAAGLPLVAKVPVLVLGHGLNVALSIISLFAHGVRLNMLEFSNNLGMQWSGYAYEPFSIRRIQET